MAQPEYDFFVRPGEARSGGQFGGAGAPDARFGSGPVEPPSPTGQFGAPATAGRTAGNQYAAPASAYQMPPATWAPPAAAPGAARRKVPGWLMAIIVVVVPLPVVVLVLFSIAIPVHANHQGAQWKNYQFVLPATLDGLPTNNSAQAKTLVNRLITTNQAELDAEYPGVYQLQGALYGNNVGLLTAHANRPVGFSEQVIATASNRADAKKDGITLSTQPTGTLGGTVSCGRSKTITECIVVDQVGQLVIVMPPDAPYGRALAIRTAVEIRR